jgi:hypothetical protein
MYNLTTIKPRCEFPFWFRRRGIAESWDVFVQKVSARKKITLTKLGTCPTNLTSREYITWDDSVTDSGSVDFAAIKDSFDFFKMNRPEAIIGTPVSPDGIEKHGAEIYDKLITGALLLQHEDDEKHALKVAEQCLTWLRSTSFISDPGSIQYHDNYESGLLQHSLRVVNCVLEFLNAPMFSTVSVQGAILAALVHDWCKIGIYEKTTRNVKNETTGEWEKHPWFKYKASQWPFGHGATSLYLAQTYFRLTLDEALSIRHHMGRWHASKAEEGDLSESNSRHPLVLMLQFADQASVAQYIPQ